MTRPDQGLSLSRHWGRVGEDPGNKVGLKSQLFENKKSPGYDGLTAEFYKAFWNIEGNLMVESLNYSYHHGELSNSQKRAIITLIEKKR